jgi:hypothetical protein
MNIELKERFILLWRKYFGETDLPIIFFYTKGDGGAEWAEKSKGWSCLICELAKVRNGISVVYHADAVACGGAKRYLGFTDQVRPGFEYFLSCGNEKIEGERYRRTPEMVKEMMKNQKNLKSTGKNIVFKRWDKLTESDEPEVVIFFAIPDVLSGLFTLANFDQVEPKAYLPRSEQAVARSSIIHILKQNPRNKGQLSGCLIPPHGHVCRKMSFHLLSQ